MAIIPTPPDDILWKIRENFERCGYFQIESSSLANTWALYQNITLKGEGKILILYIDPSDENLVKVSNLINQ